MKTITINGRTFEVKNPRNKESLTDVIQRLERTYNRDLWDCYATPSKIKNSIYNEWLEWYVEQDSSVGLFGITSYNSMQFTIGALYTDFDTMDSYELRITRDHNYAIKLADC